MDALIFDFDGVIVDSEPIHLVCFQRVLAGVGIELTHDDYYEKYLGYDDHDCMAKAAEDHDIKLTELQLTELVAQKTRHIKRAISESIEPIAGAVELVESLAGAGVPLAVCSGALYDEIELAARALGIFDCFKTIVSAEHVSSGKPDGEGYRKALEDLGKILGKNLKPSKSVAVEDSPAGIQAAHEAGMKVLAVTTSYPAGAISAADKVVDSLAKVTVGSLEELVA